MRRIFSLSSMGRHVIHNSEKDSTLTRFLALIAALAPLAAAALNHDTIVAPLAAGRFAVACSNVAQDATRIAPGASASDYWEGRPVNGVDHYLSEILAQPQAAVRYNARVPDIRANYPGHAGDDVDFVAIVCHPTPRANNDANYALPGTGDVIPHMQPAGQAPRLISAAEYAAAFGIAVGQAPNAPQRLPLIVYSHGLTGSPISKGYVDVLVQLASQGYMVAAPFHGDPRFSRVRIEDISDIVFVLRDFDHIVELQLMRPLALKVMTDVLLADPGFGFAAAIDTERIGGFGASMGGEAMALLLGARLTTSIGLACGDAVHDPRIKAAVGFVPYMGQNFLPAFCDGQSGASGVNRPYLAMSGTADTTAPIGPAQQAINRFSGSRYLVSLPDGKHEFRPEDAGDVFTWMVTFLDTYLQVPADPGARLRFFKMAGVTGGRDDRLVVDVHVPFANQGTEVATYEFFNTFLGHYFLSAAPSETAGILAGAAGAGWQLTGQSFKAWLAPPADPASLAAPVCRFYGPGPNSHFFTAEPSECELVKRDPGWFYEGIGFHARRVGSGCPAGTLQVNRAYNNRFAQNDSNHRFSTSDSTMADMARAGWIVEGTMMCANP
jgi:predicted dienelactone hydrolase